MITTTQEAQYAQLVHDHVTYRAQEKGDAGNEIQISFLADTQIEGMNLSLSGKVVSVNYQIKDETITTPATGHTGSLEGIIFTYLLSGDVINPKVEIVGSTATSLVWDVNAVNQSGGSEPKLTINLNGSVTTYTQGDVVTLIENDAEISLLFEAEASSTPSSLTQEGSVILTGGTDAVISPAIALTDYTTHDVTDAYHHASDDIKALLVVTTDDNHYNLQTEITEFLSGGQDEGDPIVTRGLYAGMTEAELLDLRDKLRKALVDVASGTQVISVTVAGKQVTKKLPEFSEIKQELATVITALTKVNPQKYGKPRRRFLMDHRYR